MGRADRILQKLNELAWVPKPFLSPLEWAVAKAMVNNPALQDKLPEERHPVEDIEITQHRLDRETVRKYARQGNTQGGLGFRRSGIVYLWDGHHRFFAAQEAGLTHTVLKVMDLTDQAVLDSEAREGMSLEQFSAQLKWPVQDIINCMDSDDRSVYEQAKLNEGTTMGRADDLIRMNEGGAQELYDKFEKKTTPYDAIEDLALALEQYSTATEDLAYGKYNKNKEAKKRLLVMSKEAGLAARDLRVVLSKSKNIYNTLSDLRAGLGLED